MGAITRLHQQKRGHVVPCTREGLLCCLHSEDLAGCDLVLCISPRPGRVAGGAPNRAKKDSMTAAPGQPSHRPRLPLFVTAWLPRTSLLLSRNTPSRRVHAPRGCSRTIRASSLEDSKRRARSKYDNIPDINEQYIAELGWVERKYGAKRLNNKSVLKEAQGSIVRNDTRAAPKRPNSTSQANDTDASVASDQNGPPDLNSYKTVRTRLVSDTLLVGALGMCAAWWLGDLRDVRSFGVGVGVAVGYVALLARSVDRMAAAARESGGGGGDGLQGARLVLLAGAVIGSARNTELFSVVMVILGFLSYKVASLIPLLTGEAFE